MQIVLTACNHLFENYLCKELLPSLRNKAQYTGKIGFLDYGCTPEALKVIEGFGAHIKRVKQECGYHHTYNFRNVHFLELLEAHPDVDHVLYVDGGDTWFQRPVEFWPEGIAHVLEPSTCDCPWFQDILHKLPPDYKGKIREATRGMLMHNCGVWIGETKLVKKYLETWHNLMCEVPGQTPFGLCQAASNYLRATRPELGFVELPRSYNYIAQANAYTLKDGELYDDQGELVHIGHNAGARLVPRIVNGQNVNVPQGGWGKTY